MGRVNRIKQEDSPPLEKKYPEIHDVEEAMKIILSTTRINS